MATRRILVVDDELHIRRLVEVNLVREGYEIEQAENGEIALAKVKQNPPDMIILDWMMPGIDGMEVLRQLQADPHYQNIPIIMLTAKAQDADVFKGWASGVSAYLTKPFNPRELLVFVDRIFQSIDRGEDLSTDDPWGPGQVFEV